VTQELWNLYLSLQTSMAYAGAGPITYDENAIQLSLGFYKGLLARCTAGPRVLLIGPGGINEVEVLRRCGLGALYVLSAHAPEIAALGAFGVEPQLVVGDMHDMSFANGSLDFVYASNVMEHALAPYVALMECRRVTADGGHAFYILPSFEGVEGGQGPFHLHCLDAKVWEELLRKTGWQVDEVVINVVKAGSVSYTGVTVQALAEKGLDTVGCEHYASFFCTAVTPPPPHQDVLHRLREFKRG